MYAFTTHWWLIHYCFQCNPIPIVPQRVVWCKRCNNPTNISVAFMLQVANQLDHQDPTLPMAAKSRPPPFDQWVTYHNSVFLWNFFSKNHRIRNLPWTFELPMAATHTRVKKLQPVRMSKWSYKQIKIYLDPSKVYLKCLWKKGLNSPIS